MIVINDLESFSRRKYKFIFGVYYLDRKVLFANIRSLIELIIFICISDGVIMVN